MEQFQRRRRPVPQAAAAAHPETETRRGARPMTPLTGAARPEPATMTAPPPRPRKTKERPPTGLLADPRVRLGLGTAAVLITACRRAAIASALRGRRRSGRSTACPAALYGPAWVIMQLGTLGAAPAAAGAARLARRPRARRPPARGRHQHLGAVQAGQADGAPAPASGTGQRHPHPRPRCRRARVPVRARGRRGRPGHGRLPASQPARARLTLRRRADRRPLPHLRRRSPPARRCGRRGTRIRR